MLCRGWGLTPIVRVRYSLALFVLLADPSSSLCSFLYFLLDHSSRIAMTCPYPQVNEEVYYGMACLGTRSGMPGQEVVTARHVITYNLLFGDIIKISLYAWVNYLDDKV